jgi:hypothetical protein
MGMDSKTLEYPGVAENFAWDRALSGTKRDRIAWLGSSNAMLPREWGKMMFFFCSLPALQPKGGGEKERMPGGL